MDTQITIKGIVEKISKVGNTFFIAQTDKGDMSVFDEDLIKLVQANVGKTITVNVEENNGYKNIRKSRPESSKVEKIPLMQIGLEIWKILRTEPANSSISDMGLIDMSAQLVKELKKVLEE
jgi:hypothetical protein